MLLRLCRQCGALASPALLGSRALGVARLLCSAQASSARPATEGCDEASARPALLDALGRAEASSTRPALLDALDTSLLPAGARGPAGVAVRPAFVSAAEEAALLAALAPALARRRYETSHWDAVISGYRELQREVQALGGGDAAAAAALARVVAACEAAAGGGAAEAVEASAASAHEHGKAEARGEQQLHPVAAQGVRAGREQVQNAPLGQEQAQSAPLGQEGPRRGRLLPEEGPRRGRLLPEVHILDLSAEGRISFHVDSPKFSGGLVAGLCLGSDAVMSLRREPPARGAGDMVRLLLPRRCLYSLTGEARYDWAHAVLPGPQRWRGAEVVKGRRVTLMLRDAKGPQGQGARGGGEG